MDAEQGSLRSSHVGVLASESVWFAQSLVDRSDHMSICTGAPVWMYGYTLE